MAQYIHPVAHRSLEHAPDHRLRLAMMLLVGLFVAALLGLAMIYYADQVAVPTWNSRSFPPPKLY